MVCVCDLVGEIGLLFVMAVLVWAGCFVHSILGWRGCDEPESLILAQSERWRHA